MQTIKYKALSPNAKSLLRCDYLMENKMQCPTHAEYMLIDVSSDSCQNPCAYHFNKLVVEENGLTFVEA